MRLIFIPLAAIVLFATTALAQVEPHPDLMAIQDNSFLLEEAYNQEPGVVQHISVFERNADADAWSFGFTQEWPFRSMRHQVSYSIPVAGNGDTELGDVALHYRYQLRGSGDALFAVAPRISLILPTGEPGQSGIQANLPISRIFAPRVAGHTNVGGSVFSEDDAWEVTVGQSFVYALSPRVQMMGEAVWAKTESESELFLSPGLRWAHNLGDLQIVPGVAFPIGVGPSSGENSVLLYLSFEHPF